MVLDADVVTNGKWGEYLCVGGETSGSVHVPINVRKAFSRDERVSRHVEWGRYLPGWMGMKSG